MEEIIIALLQFLFETLLDVLVWSPFDWPYESRRSREYWSWADPFLMFGFGAALAGLSLLVIHGTLLSTPSLRIANLVLAPPASGLLSLVRARHKERRNPAVEPEKHFWRAFAFTLGIVVVRFTYATRG